MHPKIKRMVDKMAVQAKRRGKKAGDQWFLYILRCSNNSFYTGVTKDLERRLKMHCDGRASRYTRARRPVEMIYHEPCGGRAEALVRECRVKALTREQKEQLIANGRKPSRTKKKGKGHG